MPVVRSASCPARVSGCLGIASRNISPSTGRLGVRVGCDGFEMVDHLETVAAETSRRALEGQEQSLNDPRTRAGTLLTGAALTLSFLGVQAIDREGLGCSPSSRWSRPSALHLRWVVTHVVQCLVELWSVQGKDQAVAGEEDPQGCEQEQSAPIQSRDLGARGASRVVGGPAQLYPLHRDDRRVQTTFGFKTAAAAATATWGRYPRNARRVGRQDALGA